MRFMVLFGCVLFVCLARGQDVGESREERWRETKVGLWPLLHYEVGERYRKFDLLWPLFEYKSQDESSLFSFWPLLFREREEERTFWGVLFLMRKPFVGLWGAEKSPGYVEVWMLPLLSYRKNIIEQESSLSLFMWLFSHKTTPYHTQTWLFPLFYRFKSVKDPKKTKLTLLLWLAGYSRSDSYYSVWLLPLFHHTGTKNSSSNVFLFPLIWWKRSPDYRRFAVLPFFWYSEKRNKGRVDSFRFFLFPVYYSKVYWTEMKITKRPMYRRNITIPFLFQWLYVPYRCLYIGVVPYVLFNYYHYFGVYASPRRIKIYAMLYLLQVGVSHYEFIFRLIPVIWHRANAFGNGYTVIFPLFWHFGNGNRVVSILFPLFWYIYDGEKRYTVLIGLSGYSRDSNSHFLHILFPITKIAWNTHTGTWSVTLVPYFFQVGVSRKAVRVNIFPFFYQNMDVTIKETASVGKRGNLVVFPVLWCNWDPRWRRIIVAPFFGYSWSRKGNWWSSYILPPLFYIHRNLKDDKFKFSVLGILAGYGYGEEREHRFGMRTVRGRRRYAYLSPLFWWESSPEETDFWLLAPPMRYHRYTNPTGKTTTDFMWFLPYIRYYHDESEKVIHLFWELIRYRHDLVNGRKRLSVLWYLLRWTSDPVAQRVEFNFLYRLIWYKTTPNTTKFSFFPLFSYTTTNRHPVYGRYHCFKILGGVFGGGKKANRSFMKLFFFDINF